MTLVVPYGALRRILSRDCLVAYCRVAKCTTLKFVFRTVRRDVGLNGRKRLELGLGFE